MNRLAVPAVSVVRRVPRALTWLVAGALVVSGALPGQAQDPDPLSKLGSDQARFTVELLMDSAETAGLPTRPLLSVALQGIAVKAPTNRIVEAVRKELGYLRVAEQQLGPVGEEELTAAASVLRAGAKPAQLQTFRKQRKGQNDITAFTYWADLMARGVPGEDASQAITKLWQDGADDATFYSLWRSVQADILQGLNPGTALQNRIRETPGRASPSPVKPPEGQENQSSK